MPSPGGALQDPTLLLVQTCPLALPVTLASTAHSSDCPLFPVNARWGHSLPVEPPSRVHPAAQVHTSRSLGKELASHVAQACIVRALVCRQCLEAAKSAPTLLEAPAMCPAFLARWANFKPWLDSNHARHAHAEVSATLSVSLLPSACVSLAATPPVAPIHRRAPAVMAACIVQVQASAQCLVLVRQVRSPFQVRQPSLAHRAAAFCPPFFLL